MKNWYKNWDVISPSEQAEECISKRYSGLLDVHFEEDRCRVNDKNVQQNLNIFRKLTINLIKLYKSEFNSKKPISNIKLDYLLDFYSLLQIVNRN